MRTSALRPLSWTSTLVIAGLLTGLSALSRSALATSSEPPDPADLETSVAAPEAVTWTNETAFPLAGVVRAWGVFFPANGKFYVMGGRQSDTAGSEILHPREYYPLGQTWAAKFTAFPDNQIANMVGGVLKVATKDYIVLVGGSAAGATSASSAVLVYDPILDTGAALTTDPWPGTSAAPSCPAAPRSTPTSSMSSADSISASAC